MEILNTTTMKDSENHSYTCRLPRNLAPGTTSAALKKPENEVNFLMRCKTELSSEVIHQKSENVRLQKSWNAEQQKTKDLAQKIEELRRHNEELQACVAAAGYENEWLRNRSNHKNVLYNKSVPTCDCHSFPWPESRSLLNQAASPDKESQCEDWKKTSQRLMEQMRREMKEFQEMSIHFDAEKEKPVKDQIPDEIEEVISTLTVDTVSLKENLLKQREKLKSMINSCRQGNFNKYRAVTKPSGTLDKLGSPALTPNLSDESFREYFTKQLSSSQNEDEMAKVMNMFLKSPEAQTVLSKEVAPTSSNVGKHDPSLSPASTKSNCSDSGSKFDEERMCPICEAVFPKVIPQKDFEAHVFNHLEVESASLLDQYVVL